MSSSVSLRAALLALPLLVLTGCGRTTGDYIAGPGGIVGLIILALNVYALISIIQSSASTGRKVLWVLIVWFLPVLGLIFWFLMGPKN